MNKFIKSFLVLVGLTSALAVHSAEFESNVEVNTEAQSLKHKKCLIL